MKNPVVKKLLYVTLVVFAFLLGRILPTWGGKSAHQVDSQTGNKSATDSSSLENSNQSPATLFSMDEKPVTLEDLSGDQKMSYLLLEEQIIKQRHKFLEEVALKRKILETKDGALEKNQTVSDLMDVKVSETEVKKFFESHKSSFAKDMTYEKVKPIIEQHLKKIRFLETSNTEIGSLYAKNKLQIPRTLPSLPKIDFAREPGITLNLEGTENLSVLTNMTCDSCRETWPLLRSFANNNPNFKVSVYFYTLSPSSANFLATKAFFCAQEYQSNSLTLLDELFKVPKALFLNQSGFKANVANIIENKDDMGKIEKCLNTLDNKNKRLQDSLALGQDLGLKTLETFFFFNGVPVIPRDSVSEVLSSTQKMIEGKRL